MTDYYAALHKCAERYRDMQLEAGVGRHDPLWKFTMEFMFGCREGLPLMKLNRWLGYIQGVLIERGYTTVTAERDWTRPLFRPLDFGYRDLTVDGPFMGSDRARDLSVNRPFDGVDPRA